MRGWVGWTLVAALFATSGWAAQKEAAPKPPAALSGMAAFERNVALGSQLADRQGTEAEFAEVQKLAEQGLKSAREAVQKDPTSAEAQYLLGSWLLYGYRVVKADRITYDAQDIEHRDKVSQVIQGDRDHAEEGLEALRMASNLAPQRGQYLLDYGAAMYDYDQPLLAAAALKKVWMGNLQVTAADKMRAAELMADIDAGEGDIAGARGWLYRALSENPDNAGIVQRLRKLDILEAQAAAAPPAAPEAPAATAPAEEEGPSTGEEPSVSEPATSDETGEEVAPEDEGAAGYEVGAPEEDDSQAGGEEGAWEEQPEAGETEEAPAEPETQ